MNYTGNRWESRASTVKVIMQVLELAVRCAVNLNGEIATSSNERNVCRLEAKEVYVEAPIRTTRRDSEDAES